MSGEAKRIERRQRFRRVRRGENRKRAVSPVVATLILILIAVAAAAALYLWLVVWQGNLTRGIGQPTAEATVTIGGSTSAYPFDQVAVTWFEQNNSDIVISNGQGGTGAGMAAVCQGNIDIGVASTPETVSGLQKSYGCAPTVTITTVAYDAVDVVVQGANPHGLLSVNYDTLDVLYSQGSTTTPNIPVTTSSTIDGAKISTLGLTIPAPGTEFAWDQIPAAVSGAAFPGIGVALDSPEAVTGVAPAAGVACTGTGYTDDICAATGPGSATPCGFTVCAGSVTTGSALIVPVERSDAAGTTQTFEAKLLSYTASNAIATSFGQLGYNGCGSNNLLSDCGISVPTQEVGDTGLLGEVAGNANAIGYASDGLARTTPGIGLSGIIPVDAAGQVGTLPQTSGSNVAYGAVVPTTGATGSIAAGISDSSTVNQYSGWRPFEFVTLQPPTGEVERLIQFILEPANNENLATATAEVSLYTV